MIKKRKIDFELENSIQKVYTKYSKYIHPLPPLDHEYFRGECLLNYLA